MVATATTAGTIHRNAGDIVTEEALDGVTRPRLLARPVVVRIPVTRPK
jgi:hypothetical protein